MEYERNVEAIPAKKGITKRTRKNCGSMIRLLHRIK
jgi:hypothetical protein